ncbi:MAG: HEAT repeat domain-containing protein [Anaerolineae bacterium]|jgi:hypothetical protein|nr:HEAT repeat domain-containing protein [Chloroflexota bacterium]
MSQDFDQALAQLTTHQGPVDRALVQRFSGAEARDVASFRAKFSTLADTVRTALLASMVEYAESDFELDFGRLYRIALDDALPAVRRMAIEGLWEDERPDLMRRLLSLLAEDPADEVRAAAAASLGRFIYLAECDELEIVPRQVLREALELAHGDASIEVARRALESLAYISEPHIIRLIDAAYSHADPLMRQSALFAMGRSTDRFWAETVLAELHNESPAMRYEAARACGELRLERALPLLARMLSDRDAEVQSMAVWALGEIGGKRAQQLLEGLADGEDEALSAAAQAALDSLSFASGPMDLLVFDDNSQEAHGGHDWPVTEDDDSDGDEDWEHHDEREHSPELEDYRRLFERYLDEDDDSDDTDGGWDDNED